MGPEEMEFREPAKIRDMSGAMGEKRREASRPEEENKRPEREKRK